MKLHEGERVHDPKDPDSEGVVLGDSFWGVLVRRPTGTVHVIPLDRLRRVKKDD